MIVLPAMPPEQTASWLGLLDLHENLPDGWTLIGGQLVHLHCAERGQFPVRPTNDADAVIDVRADPMMLATFTGALSDLGFTSTGNSAEGLQHRWGRGDASIDVLLPDGIGERARLRHGVTGSPTLSTAGGTQALQPPRPLPSRSTDAKDPYVGPAWSAPSSARRQRSATPATPASAVIGGTSSSSPGCSPPETSGTTSSRRQTADGCAPWSLRSWRTARSSSIFRMPSKRSPGS